VEARRQPCEAGADDDGFELTDRVSVHAATVLGPPRAERTGKWTYSTARTCATRGMRGYGQYCRTSGASLRIVAGSAGYVSLRPFTTLEVPDGELTHD
jgi:hypothetical protein